MNIVYQGEPGAYSHIAVNSLFGAQVESQGYEDFTTPCDLLTSGDADFAVLPIENSTHGSVYQNYDNISNYNLEIYGELYLKINFHLIVHPGKSIQDITEVYTHPVALSQIKQFIQEHPSITFKKHEDTAGSVKMIKEKNMVNAGAAASRFAAELYDMQVIEENIHENSKNYTRCFVLGKKGLEQPQLHTHSESHKTTIQFVLGTEPGSLYKSLRSFADRDISLSKIESRPILNTDWEYRFYIDVEGHVEADAMQASLKELREYVQELNILGSYQKGVYIDT